MAESNTVSMRPVMVAMSPEICPALAASWLMSIWVAPG
jgi:hypothetical protein